MTTQVGVRSNEGKYAKPYFANAYNNAVQNRHGQNNMNSDVYENNQNFQGQNNIDS